MHVDPRQVLELIAVGLGLHSVWALSDGKRLGWLTGLASVVLSAAVCVLNSLWGQVGLMAVFAVLSLSGWLAWQKASNAEFVPLRATRMVWIVSTLLVVVLFPVLWWLLLLTGDPAPLLDAIVSTLSLVAVYWQAKRWAENWWLWAIANLASVIMFWQMGLWAFLLYYAALLLMCLRGWLSWQAMAKAHADSLVSAPTSSTAANSIDSTQATPDA